MYMRSITQTPPPTASSNDLTDEDKNKSFTKIKVNKQKISNSNAKVWFFRVFFLGFFTGEINI